MYAVKATGTLRVSKAGELEGLDLHEHGMLAYPEYVIHGYSPTLHHVEQAPNERLVAVPSPSSASTV
jgi:Amt family ammonium transporter